MSINKGQTLRIVQEAEEEDIPNAMDTCQLYPWMVGADL